MKRKIQTGLLGALLVCVWIFSSTVTAESMWYRSDTYFSASHVRPVFGATDKRSQVPIYEFFQMRTWDLGVPNLQVELSGFAGVFLTDSPISEPGVESERYLGNVLVGLLSWQNKKGTFSASLGRQYLFVGTGQSAQLDGLSLDYQFLKNINLKVFGGRTNPWQVDYSAGSVDNESWLYSNYAMGSNLSWRLFDLAVAQAGFFHEGHDDDIVRQNVSLDVGYWGWRKLEVLAGSVFDTITVMPQEIWGQLISHPTARLKITLDGSHQIPSLLIPQTSIFSVFTSKAFEQVQTSLYYGLTPRLSGGLEGGVRRYDTEADSWDYGTIAAVQINYAFDDISGRLLGLRMQYLDTSAEQLVEGRIFAMYRFSLGLFANADLYLTHLQSEQSGEAASIFMRKVADHSSSIGGLGLVGYQISPRLSFQVSGSIFSTPTSEYDLRTMARLSYDNGWGK